MHEYMFALDGWIPIFTTIPIFQNELGRHLALTRELEGTVHLLALRVPPSQRPLHLRLLRFEPGLVGVPESHAALMRSLEGGARQGGNI